MWNRSLSSLSPPLESLQRLSRPFLLSTCLLTLALALSIGGVVCDLVGGWQRADASVSARAVVATPLAKEVGSASPSAPLARIRAASEKAALTSLTLSEPAEDDPQRERVVVSASGSYAQAKAFLGAVVNDGTARVALTDLSLRADSDGTLNFRASFERVRQ